jgi:hypothetical protein
MIETLLLSLVIAGQSPATIQIHEGKHWIWYAREDHYREHKASFERFYEYADKAFDYLGDAWGMSPKGKYALLAWEQRGGGFATGNISEVSRLTGKPSPGIGVSYDAFFGSANGVQGYWAYVLITHEMVNLFTGEVVSGGWPVDWWANHRSPFPYMTAVAIEYALKPEVAVHHDRATNDPLVRMFQRLKDQYGWHMFRRAFTAAREDGVNWDRIGANPSPLRTNYVAAYLQIGAPEDIFGVLAKEVPGFDREAAAKIVAARERWRAMPESDERTRLREAFLRGEYE